MRTEKKKYKQTFRQKLKEKIQKEPTQLLKLSYKFAIEQLSTIFPSHFQKDDRCIGLNRRTFHPFPGLLKL